MVMVKRKNSIDRSLLRLEITEAMPNYKQCGASFSINELVSCVDKAENLVVSEGLSVKDAVKKVAGKAIKRKNYAGR